MLIFSALAEDSATVTVNGVGEQVTVTLIMKNSIQLLSQPLQGLRCCFMAIFLGLLIEGNCMIDILFDAQSLFIQLGKLVSGIDDAGCGFVFRSRYGFKQFRCPQIILFHPKAMFI